MFIHVLPLKSVLHLYQVLTVFYVQVSAVDGCEMEKLCSTESFGLSF